MSAIVVGCTSDLPPHGEALISVDTNLSPSFAQQLRVDVHTSDGRWIQSRDFLQAQATDWPTSFGVVAPIDDFEGEIVLRLRLFPHSGVRDYLGERFYDDPAEQPVVQTSLTTACAEPLVQPVGEARWHRLGETAFTSPLSTGGCTGHDSGVGVAVLRIDIPASGTYRLQVLESIPAPSFVGGAWAIQLREQCDAEPSAIACVEGELQESPRPSMDRDLRAGSYFVVVSGPLNWAPMDVLVGVERLDEATGLSLVPRDPPPSTPTERLELHGGLTPETEPLPSVTVDRLVRVHLEDGQRGIVPLLLDGNCLGVQAVLRADRLRPGIVPQELESCVNGDAVRSPVPLVDPVPKVSPLAVTVSGTFPATEDCADTDDVPGRVCIPGGLFTVGGRHSALTSEEASPHPERAAVMSRFWLDQREVTVGEWRKAVKEGAVSLLSAVANDDPYPTGYLGASGGYADYCTFTTVEMGRDDWPMTCVTWDGARAFCASRGGDLPTAAQWEYAATAAGRSGETLLPWGNDTPRCSPSACADSDGDCHGVVYSRFYETVGLCVDEGFGPTPISAYEGEHGDRTLAIGDEPDSVVFGLAGGVTEMVLDSFRAYDSPCWRHAGLTDPMCRERHAPQHEHRGSSWAFTLPLTFSAARERGPHRSISPSVGFRCAYSEP